MPVTRPILFYGSSPGRGSSSVGSNTYILDVSTTSVDTMSAGVRTSLGSGGSETVNSGTPVFVYTIPKTGYYEITIVGECEVGIQPGGGVTESGQVRALIYTKGYVGSIFSQVASQSMLDFASNVTGSASTAVGATMSYVGLFESGDQWYPAVALVCSEVSTTTSINDAVISMKYIGS